MEAPDEVSRGDHGPRVARTQCCVLFRGENRRCAVSWGHEGVRGLKLALSHLRSGSPFPNSMEAISRVWYDLSRSALVPTRSPTQAQRKRLGMGRISSAVVGAMILMVAPQAIGRAEQSAQVPTVVGEYGPWGFDLTGIDPSAKPGDDFFRFANGAWHDRTIIAPDRDSNGIDRILNDVVELRIRDILERGENGVEASARADAAKIGAFYAAFMNEARAETLDAQPIKPLIQQLRAAVSRDDLAGLMGASPGTFLDSIFNISIDVDAKAPDKYVVLIGQGGLGLPDRDYYLTPQFADKKAAYQAYIAQILA